MCDQIENLALVLKQKYKDQIDIQQGEFSLEFNLNHTHYRIWFHECGWMWFMNGYQVDEEDILHEFGLTAI
jgi:hypothetical protein